MGNWSVYDGIGNGYADKLFFNNNGRDYQTPNHNSVVGRDGNENSANGQYRARANGYNDVSFAAGYEDGATIGKQYGDYLDATIGSDNIELEVNNMYPGYGQLFRSNIINLCTVAAKLSALSFSATGNEGGTLDADAANMLGLALRVTDEQDKQIYDLATGSNATFTLGDVTFVRLSALTNATVKEVNQMMTASKP